MAGDLQDGSSDSDMVNELQKTVTIVFWYKENTEPIRLQHMIPTFPLFQLSRFTSLVTDLGLTATSYLDTYNPQSGKWDQHTISSVRVVETNQRLLYRIRKSLLEGLVESECTSLDEEVESQPKPDSQSTNLGHSPVTRKRSSSVTHESMPPAKQFIPNTHYPTATPEMSATPVAGPSSSSAHDQVPQHQDHDLSPSLSMSPQVSPPNPSNYMYQPQTFYNSTPGPTTVTLPSYLVNPPTDLPPIPYHPHPPLKRWPNDYTVAQLSVGFHALEALCSHSHVIAVSPTGETTSATAPNLTQKSAFERVFGSRYVKSTVCRHRGVWRRAPREIREEFERFGDDERGMWGEFVRRAEGKPPGKVGLAVQQVQSQARQAASTSSQHDQSQAHAQSQSQQQQQQPVQQMMQHGMQAGSLLGLPGVQQMVPGHELVFHAMGPGMSMSMLQPSSHQRQGGKKQKSELDAGLDSLQGDSPSSAHPSSHSSGLQNGIGVYDPSLSSVRI
ncbi:hypothetical protein D9758_012004 [Tetrapyrgos nigripes]|uniref:Uncharacterized protein n=1 Tax=Tetrapyrgos nigripes TaxID=182062 RepID=A0A8H5CR63_9AGAR|nr:hypothetical protein D9758_012004 [Tetrapyrgos nigripes]